MSDDGETVGATAARLLRMLDERVARRRIDIAASPTAEQLVFDLSFPEAMKSGAR